VSAGEEYAGPAVLVAGGTTVSATVRLRGHVDPIDGLFHWYGRLGADPALDALGNGAKVILRTDHGEAPGRLCDLDPWGRLRIEGTGPAPF
jgi:hypothetical protein